MRNDAIVYKGIIKEFNENIETVSTIKVMYKIININNMYYFAEEISTGCIFPIYYAMTKGEVRLVNHFSHILSGKYFAFFPLVPSEENVFEYTANKFALEKFNILEATNKEIDDYLEQSIFNYSWKDKIKAMEAENTFAYNLEYIKEIIKKVKSNEFNFSNGIKINNSKLIDFKEISDYGYNMIDDVNGYDLIKRNDEIKSIIKRVFINNGSIILVGPSGSGKTTIVKEIAGQIKEGNNKWLKDKTIFSLNLASLVGGTRYRGEFEERMNKFISFCKKHRGKLVIFIDEIHNVYGLGKSQDASFDAMNILKAYLDSGDITIIGTTTNEEFLKYMVNDEAFLRRVTRLNIKPIDNKLNSEIIDLYIDYLERKCDIRLNLSYEERIMVIDYLLDITDVKNQRVVGDITVMNPTITKNLIDEAFGEALYNEKMEVTIDEICYAIVNCEKLGLTFRKERANELKRKMLCDNKVKTRTGVLNFKIKND